MIVEVSPVRCHVVPLCVVLFDPGAAFANLLAPAMRFVLPSLSVAPLIQHPLDHLFADDLAWLREGNGPTTVWAGDVEKPAVFGPTVLAFKTKIQFAPLSISLQEPP